MVSVHHPGVLLALAILGNIISFVVYLAPLPTFYQIYKRKTTGGFQSVPYLVALFSCMLWLSYGLLLSDGLALIVVNSGGCVIETIYIAIYIAYATREARNHSVKMLVLLNLGMFSAILLFTHFLVRGLNRIHVLGWICAGFSVTVFAAPLSIVAQVIRTRSVEFMPFTLSFTLTLSAIIWFFYGLSKRDNFVAFPNILGFILGLLQMILYGIFKNSKNAKKSIEEKKLPEHIVNIVILSSLGNSEVHPLDVEKPSPNDKNKDNSSTSSRNVGEDEKEKEDVAAEEKKDGSP